MTEKIIVAAGGVIVEKNKVLLCLEKKHKFWSFPGGKVEIKTIKNWRDSLEQTARREVKEELGVGLKIIKPLKPMFLPRIDQNHGHVLLIHYLAVRQGKIKPGPDIEDWGWFSLNQLPANCAGNIKPVINTIDN